MTTYLKTDLCEYGQCINQPVYTILFQVLDGTIMQGKFCDPCAQVIGQLHHIIRVAVIDKKTKKEGDQWASTSKSDRS